MTRKELRRKLSEILLFQHGYCKQETLDALEGIFYQFVAQEDHGLKRTLESDGIKSK